MNENEKVQCLEHWELCKESGTAQIFAVVGCSLSQGFYCSASGASVADLPANVKQIPAYISMVSYVYHFVGVYLFVYLVVYFCLFRFIFSCVGHGVDIVFCSSWCRPCSVA